MPYSRAQQIGLLLLLAFVGLVLGWRLVAP
jgi:hypothetical protein